MKRVCERITGPSAAERDAGLPGRRILTVKDVRRAISEVAAGRFGGGEPGDLRDETGNPAGPGANSDVRGGTSAAVSGTSAAPDGASAGDGAIVPADVPDRSAAAPDSAHNDPGYSSAGLLGLWSESVLDSDRRQAREAAQLAAFALARLLNRADGEAQLERFLTAVDMTGERGSKTAGRESGTEARTREGPDSGEDSPDGPGSVGRDSESSVSDRMSVVEKGDVEEPRLTWRAGELLKPDDLMIVSARLRKAKRATARQRTARAIVWFIGFHNLLRSVASGRLSFERIARLHFRIDDAMLPLAEVQALDRYLDAMDANLSMGQFEQMMRKKIRTLVPVPEDPEAPYRLRRIRLERCDDDTGILTLTGPVDVLDALYQRTRAVARSIRGRELSALGLLKDGESIDASGVADRMFDDRTLSQLMFDLLAGARPQTQIRVGASAEGRTSEESAASAACVGSEGSSPAAAVTNGVTLDGSPTRSTSPPLPEPGERPDEWMDVLCPTEGTWLRKQAAVHVTVPASTLLGINEEPGWTTGDATLSAVRCRQIASHATSWVRILTDPVTGVVTDDIAQTYEPTAAMRRTVRQKWRTCTAPGCVQPAGSCEIDHCCSFSKKDPSRGGLTVVENLHPLCKHHHQLKTQGVIGVRRVSGDAIVWVLPMGVRDTAVPPPVGDADIGTDPDGLGRRARCADGTEVPSADESRSDEMPPRPPHMEPGAPPPF